MSNIRCPVCGYDFYQPKDMSIKILDMITNYDESTQKVIKRMMRLIYDNVPSDKSVGAYYFFLRGIMNVEEEHIRYGIRVFDKSSYYKQGKGFRYLHTIIINREKNFLKQLKNERQLYGKSPKKSIIE